MKLYIKNKVVSLGGGSHVFDENEKVFQKFSIGKKRFVINGYKEELKIDGDFIGFDYSIYKGEEMLG